VSQPSDRDRSAEFDHRLVKALAHPVRADFLRLLGERSHLSAVEALGIRDSELNVGQVVYHARVLADLELIEPVGEPDPRRGLPYGLTASGRHALLALGVSSDNEGNG